MRVVLYFCCFSETTYKNSVFYDKKCVQNLYVVFYLIQGFQCTEHIEIKICMLLDLFGSIFYSKYFIPRVKFLFSEGISLMPQ